MSVTEKHVSYDVAVIQWITSCHKKSYDHMCNNALARTRNGIDNVRVNNAFSYWNKGHFEGNKIRVRW